MAAASVLGIK